MVKSNKTKKKREPTFSTKVDFTNEDKGYSDLLNPKLLNFIFKNLSDNKNMINTQKGKPFFVNKKTILHLRSKKWKSWGYYPTWEQIQCKEFNHFIKHTPCDIGKNVKIFVKIKSTPQIAGFANYILSLHLGLITKAEHFEFVNALQKTFKDKPIINHNEDLDWFHLKSIV